MSMLAEPRRRQKWTLNPRGNLWSKDDSRFGKKLMEKMGWEDGKGLGASSQGMTDPITVRAKDNNEGIGYQGRDDVWLDHQNDFDAILANLNQQHNTKTDDDPKKMKSLEETSKTSKKRVHYQKFTRGKDISRFSVEDLGCILGGKKKEARKSKKRGLEEEEEQKEPMDEDEAALSDDGVQVVGFKMTTEVGPDKAENDTKKKENTFVTLNRGSMNDYFLQKMKMKAGGGPVKPQESDHTEKSTELDPPVPSELPEKKRKNKRSKQDNSPSRDEEMKMSNGEVQMEEIQDVNLENGKKKKTKKSNDLPIEDPVLTIETPDQSETMREEETSQEDGKNKRKKKKKSKANKRDMEVDMDRTESSVTKEAISESGENKPGKDDSSKEGKRAKKRRDCENLEDPLATNHGEEGVREKMKKKKSKKSKKDRLEEEHDPIQQTPSKEVTKDKSSRKQKIDYRAIFNINKTSRRLHKKKEKVNKTSMTLPKQKIAKSVIISSLKTIDLGSKLGYKGTSIASIQGYGSHVGKTTRF